MNSQLNDGMTLQQVDSDLIALERLVAAVTAQKNHFGLVAIAECQETARLATTIFQSIKNFTTTSTSFDGSVAVVPAVAFAVGLTFLPSVVSAGIAGLGLLAGSRWIVGKRSENLLQFELKMRIHQLLMHLNRATSAIKQCHFTSASSEVGPVLLQIENLQNEITTYSNYE